MAATELGRYGRIGVGSINDGDGGVVCVYDGVTGALQKIFVSAPVVFARDRSVNVDTQLVGWRFIIKRQPRGGGTQTTVFKSSVVKSSATDAQAAAFTDRTRAMTSVTYNSDYIVIIKLLWYTPNGRNVAGWQKHRVDYYTYWFPDLGNRGYYNVACFDNGA